MARGNSKLGGFGRGRRADERGGPDAAWPTDGPDASAAPAAPSPARNILPGEPFEPVIAGFPAQRSPEPAPFAATAPAGWGSAQIPVGVGAMPEPGLLTGDAFPPGWPGDASTHPMPAVPGADHPAFGHAGGADPLDALQQYAGLPVGGAPAPDPSQLHPMTQASAEPTGASAPVDSGFADGGIFTGADLPGSDFPGYGAPGFPGLPSQGYPQATGLPTGLPTGFDPQAPTPDHVPQRNLEPIGAPRAFGDVLPGSDTGFGSEFGPAAGLDADLEDGPRRGRRRAKRETGRRRAGADSPESSNGSRRAVALLGVVAVLGAAGYVGYSQLAGTSDDTPFAATTTPVKPSKAKPATTAGYTLPTQIADLTEISPALVKQLTASYTQLSAQQNPNLPAPLTATAYQQRGASAPTVNVVIYKPASTTVYTTLVASLSRPSTGNASVAGVPTAPGAAGGTMLCGSQHGATSSAWCAWNSPKGIGFVQAKNTANPAYPASYARELRAYAER